MLKKHNNVREVKIVLRLEKLLLYIFEILISDNQILLE